MPSCTHSSSRQAGKGVPASDRREGGGVPLHSRSPLRSRWRLHQAAAELSLCTHSMRHSAGASSDPAAATHTERERGGRQGSRVVTGGGGGGMQEEQGEASQRAVAVQTRSQAVWEFRGQNINISAMDAGRLRGQEKYNFTHTPHTPTEDTATRLSRPLNHCLHTQSPSTAPRAATAAE